MSIPDDDLAALAGNRSGPGWQECSVHYALRALPRPTAELLVQALANPVPKNSEIAKAINARFDEDVWQIDAQAVGRHRAEPQRCKCKRCRCGTCASLGLAP